MKTQAFAPTPSKINSKKLFPLPHWQCNNAWNLNCTAFWFTTLKTSSGKKLNVA